MTGFLAGSMLLTPAGAHISSQLGHLWSAPNHIRDRGDNRWIRIPTAQNQMPRARSRAPQSGTLTIAPNAPAAVAVTSHLGINAHRPGVIQVTAHVNLNNEAPKPVPFVVTLPGGAAGGGTLAADGDAGQGASVALSTAIEVTEPGAVSVPFVLQILDPSNDPVPESVDFNGAKLSFLFVPKPFGIFLN